jgi:signal transduction histidine kinase
VRPHGLLARLPVRARLVVGFVLAMVVVLTGAGAFVFWRVQFALDKRLTEDLAAQTADLRDAARLSAPTAALSALGGRSRAGQLLAADGRVLAGGPGLGRTPLLRASEARAAVRHEVRTSRGTLFSPRGRHVRIRALPVRAAGPGRAAVAVSVVRLDQRDEALRELLVQLAVANLVALALASGVGYRLARGALDPVERYRARAERITRGATGVRLDVPPGPRDEISRLGSTLNAMLAAQERAAARQGQFVDDASHELRTPLSALSAEVELALARDRPAEELRDALRRIADDTARLSALADELLTLGSLGRTTADARPIAASEACERAAGRARTQLGDGSGRPVVVEAAEELPAWADPGLLDRALGNLVDNAVRHGAGTITVSARAVDEPAALACVLAVHDEGPGPPAAFLPHAAERFRRGETSRSGPGSGLGLALVDAIATAHGGQLRICAGGAHHRQEVVDEALDTVPCRHPAAGTTAALLLPGRPAGG